MRFSKGISSAEEAYWFGFLVGDGCIYENRYRLKLSLQKKDSGHLIKFAKFLGYGEDRIHFYGSMAEFRVDNKELLTRLYKLGLCQNKVHKTHKGLIPKKFKRDFVRGLFDADGTIHLRHQKNYLTANFHICGTYDLLSGIESELVKKIRKNNGTVGCICINQPSTLEVNGRWLIEKVGHYLYDGTETFLERKHKIFQTIFAYNKKHSRQWNRFARKDIKKIKKLYDRGSITQEKIARIFGISQTFVSRIINGKRYEKLAGGD